MYKGKNLARKITRHRAATAQEDAMLQVFDGDFSDLSSMTGPKGNGWYRVMPEDWQAQSRNVKEEGNYAVNSYDGATKPVCNVCNIGFLKQQPSVVPEISDVILEFDVSGPRARALVLAWPSSAMRTIRWQDRSSFWQEFASRGEGRG